MAASIFIYLFQPSFPVFIAVITVCWGVMDACLNLQVSIPSLSQYCCRIKVVAKALGIHHTGEEKDRPQQSGKVSKAKANPGLCSRQLLMSEFTCEKNSCSMMSLYKRFKTLSILKKKSHCPTAVANGFDGRTREE